MLRSRAAGHWSKDCPQGRSGAPSRGGGFAQGGGGGGGGTSGECFKCGECRSRAAPVLAWHPLTSTLQPGIGRRTALRLVRGQAVAGLVAAAGGRTTPASRQVRAMLPPFIPPLTGFDSLAYLESTLAQTVRRA